MGHGHRELDWRALAPRAVVPLYMKRILVLEDESSIREFVVINLKRAGYSVLEASDGEEALHIFSQNPDIDIAILDVMLEGSRLDGIEVCQRMRAENPSVGIIMLTAKTQELDKLSGFMSGADDYVTKPFSPSELMARVDALYRKISLMRNYDRDKVIESGPFKLSGASRTVFKNNEELDLTHVEFQMLQLFIENPGTAFSREDILNRVWGADYEGELKTVDVNIRRLRVKVEDDPSDPRYIRTVWGFGYKWGLEHG